MLWLKVHSHLLLRACQYIDETIIMVYATSPMDTASVASCYVHRFCFDETTDMIRCGSVVVNVMQIVAYRSWDDGTMMVWVVFHSVIGHCWWLLTRILLLDAILMRCYSQLFCHSSESLSM